MEHGKYGKHSLDKSLPQFYILIPYFLCAFKRQAGGGMFSCFTMWTARMDIVYCIRLLKAALRLHCHCETHEAPSECISTLLEPRSSVRHKKKKKHIETTSHYKSCKPEGPWSRAHAFLLAQSHLL